MDFIKIIDDYLNLKVINCSFFRVYPFSNEKINGYIPFFDLQGKSLVTLGSSCDQAINARLAGCDDITIFDICPLTKFYFYLKFASLETLNREEFLNFLMRWTNAQVTYNPLVYSKDTFYRIKDTLKNLDYDSYQLWEYIFEKYHKYTIFLLFRDDIETYNQIISNNDYLLNDDNYNRARKSMSNCKIRIETGDISNIIFEEKSDNIWLSNAIDYIDDTSIYIMIKNMIDSLKQDGRLLLKYYMKNNYTKRIPGIELLEENLSRFVIANGNGEYGNNSVSIYQKKLKQNHF